MTDTGSAAAVAAATSGAVFIDMSQPSDRCCPSCYLKGGILPAEKPSELSSVPFYLWDEMKNALNKVILGYNFLQLVFPATFAIVFAAYFLFIFLSNGFGYETEDDEDYQTNEILEVVLFLIIGGYIAQAVLLEKRKNDQIQEIMRDFHSRFAAQGYYIRYERENSGLCKKKHQPEVQRLVFAPTTAAATDNNATAVAVADVESPSPQFSPAPDYTHTGGQFTTTTAASTSTANIDDNPAPSVVDQMMADLNRPL